MGKRNKYEANLQGVQRRAEAKRAEARKRTDERKLYVNFENSAFYGFNEMLRKYQDSVLADIMAQIDRDMTTMADAFGTFQGTTRASGDTLDAYNYRVISWWEDVNPVRASDEIQRVNYLYGDWGSDSDLPRSRAPARPEDIWGAPYDPWACPFCRGPCVFSRHLRLQGSIEGECHTVHSLPKPE